VPVGNPSLIGLDLPLTTLIGVAKRRRNILTCTYAYENNKSKSLSVMTRGPRILDMQGIKNDMDSSLLAVFINTLKQDYQLD
jgi:hypothetical protein